MKKFIVLVVMSLVLVFSAGFVFAEEDKEEKKNGWNFVSEAEVGAWNKYVDQFSGEIRYNHSVFTQLAMIGIEKNGTGFYLQPENFTPFNKKDYGQSDFFLGLYTEQGKTKIDAGYAYYQLRTRDEVNYHGLYAEIELPEIWKKIIPFVKAEYLFAAGRMEDEDGRKISLNGFVYKLGFKKEFEMTKISEKLSINMMIAIGGNTGIYGLPAENVALLQGGIGTSFALDKHWKIKFSSIFQYNNGSKEGVAAGTDLREPLLNLSISWSF